MTYNHVSMELSEFVKQKRKAARMTQPELAYKSGVGLRLIREIEQGKSSFRMDKVNQVLSLFGAELGVVSQVKPQYDEERERI
jgi:y4mF family transcriptional regulator